MINSFKIHTIQSWYPVPVFLLGLCLLNCNHDPETITPGRQSPDHSRSISEHDFTDLSALHEKLDDKQHALLKVWFASSAESGDETEKSSFGELVLKSAMFQKGKPYYAPPQTRADESGIENINLQFESFDCVSFVESSLALARCIYSKQIHGDCFVQEIIASRYRSGIRGDYASRLHYFSDWILDNSIRNRLNLPGGLDGEQVLVKNINYMSAHLPAYPALKDAQIYKRILPVEKKLSTYHFRYLPRDQVAKNESKLQNGDIVAIITSKKGLLISHAGFVLKLTPSKAALLHASSYHKRILIPRGRLSDYVLAQKDRRGILIARPMAPE